MDSGNVKVVCRLEEKLIPRKVKEAIFRRQIDIVTYKLIYFLPDMLLCLFVDDLFKKKVKPTLNRDEGREMSKI